MISRILVRRAGNGFTADWGQGPRPCAIGRSGVGAKGGEGDGITPQGIWPLRYGFYRADKIPRPETQISLRPIAKDDGWCDAPDDPNYNTAVTLPYPASAEHLWRDDDLYDLVLVMGFNDAPVVAGKGSAIFLHLAAPGFSPTEGCVALPRSDLVTLLGDLSPDAVVDIAA